MKTIYTIARIDWFQEDDGSQTASANGIFIGQVHQENGKWIGRHSPSSWGVDEADEGAAVVAFQKLHDLWMGQVLVVLITDEQPEADGTKVSFQLEFEQTMRLTNLVSQQLEDLKAHRDKFDQGTVAFETTNTAMAELAAIGMAVSMARSKPQPSE